MPFTETTDPSLRSWVTSANDGGTDFPLQNLPFGVFRRAHGDEQPRVGVAIGDRIVDVSACSAAGLLRGDGLGSDTGPLESATRACASPTLNALMRLGTAPRVALRTALSVLLRDDAQVHARQIAEHALVAQSEAEMFLPVEIGDYTDFYASVHHASNVGALFRPDNPLLPNYKWIPIGYHGRSSSIVLSGTPIRRPAGQRKGPSDSAPVVRPSAALDYELELGLYVGTGNAMGSTIPLADVRDHMFGVSLLNDWSARDIQSWEYQPLGPFLAKNFASSVSPWVVTMEALEPFRVAPAARDEGDPAPLPYLHDEFDTQHGAFDITLDVHIASSAMRSAHIAPMALSQANARTLYWTLGQMLTHHASAGCNMRSGDLLGSGTVSGPDAINRGCLLEITTRGAHPVTLPTGETRTFLEDGDEIVLSGYAVREGAVRIGLGSCRGIVTASG